MTGAQMPPVVRSLRVALENLEDLQIERARISADAKRTAQADDIRSKVVAEATRLAHGGSGDVKSELFEDLFESELRKYDRFSAELKRNKGKQEKLLDGIRVRSINRVSGLELTFAPIQSNMDTFLRDRKEDSRVEHREKKLQEMELAYWKWREVTGNCQEGIKFYTDFQAILQRLRESAHEWVYSRRVDVQRITAQMQAMEVQHQEPEAVQARPTRAAAAPHPPVSPPPPMPKAKPQTFTLPPPGSGAWQSALDDLPPSPPQQSYQSDYQAPAPEPPAAATPSRVTRSSAAKAVKGSIPNPFQSPGPRKGHGVV